MPNPLAARRGGLKNYLKTMLRVRPEARVALWPLTEPSGAVANDVGGQRRHGAYSGGLLANTRMFDEGQWTASGTSHVNVYSASLNTAWPKTTGSIAGWLLMPAATWTDTSTQRYLLDFYIDGTAKMYITKETTQYDLVLERKANSVDKYRHVAVGDLDPTQPIHVGMTWDSGAGELKYYINGACVGTDTGAAAQVGNLAAATSVLGRDTTSGTKQWVGGVGYVAVWNAVLTEAEMAALARRTLDTPVSYTATGEFTIAVIPDTQDLAENANWRWEYNTLTQWVVDNATAYGIKACIHMGDLVADATIGAQWTTAKAAIDILGATEIPYHVCTGNHDYTDVTARTKAQFDTDYPQSRYTGHAWASGMTFYEAGKSENATWTITVNGVDYLFVDIEYSNPYRAAVMSWADGILTANNTKPAFVFTHGLLDSSGAYYDAQVQHVWDDVLKLHDNVVLCECGHSVGYGQARRTDNSDGASPIHQIMANYQVRPDYTYHAVYLRLITIRPSTQEIIVQAYSPNRKRLLTTDQDHFTLTYKY